MSGTRKEACRLCYYETVDITDVYSPDGVSFDYIGKINKYLHLSVLKGDGLPTTVCWMCRTHLETFHKFYEKINDIQKQRITTIEYECDALPAQPDEKLEIQSNDVFVEKKNDATTVINSDGNTYEIVVISNDNFEEEKEVSAADAEFEEYELLEVDHLDANTESQDDHQVKPLQSNEITLVDVHDDIQDTENEPEKSYQITTRQKQRLTTTEQIKKQNICTKERIHGMAKTQLSALASAGRRQTKLTTMQKDKRQHGSTTKMKNQEDSSDIEMQMQQYCDDIAEGQSDDEFPARDSDNEDWPSPNTLGEFPTEIIRDGLLLVKGKQLMSIICRFYNLECKQCDRKVRFKKLNSLFDHYTNAHKQPGYVECCQTKFSRYPAIIMHMARHLQPDAFKCDECGYIVTRPRFLESHKQTHLPDDQKPFACDKCARRFCWKSALRIHMISHSRHQYVCQICDRKYDTPGGLSTHKKLAHSGYKPSKSNVCHICAKNLSTRTGLREHMITIHQPREKAQLQCNECGKWLMNNRCLKTHMILHSDVEFRCDKCEYVTKKKALLNRHLLTQHSNSRPYKCDRCGRDFKMKRSLTIHIAQHGSTKKFQCQFCNRSFNSSTNFYAHRKSAHPKELQAMRQREEDERRRKRIEAGVEEDSTTAQINRNTQLILTTDNGEEFTVLEIAEERS